VTADNGLRDRLIAICERAFVPEDKWHDRDSEKAQRQLGECYALLRAGCEVSIDEEQMAKGDFGGKTLWVSVRSKGFNFFEIGEMREETYYLPTEARLDEAAGGDWYC
jgi:hypothetical protein